MQIIKTSTFMESAGCFYFKKRILKSARIAGPPCLRIIFLSAVKAPYVAAPMTNNTKIVTISKLCEK